VFASKCKTWVLSDDPDPRRIAHQAYLAAHALGGEPDLDWTFALFLDRAKALTPEAGPHSHRGLDHSYEPLRSWNEVVHVLTLSHILLEAGVEGAQAYSVVAGIEFFESGYRVADGRLPLPAPGDPFRGRHSAVLAGVLPTGELVFSNSWGASWGEDGFGYISRAYFEGHVDAVWATRPSWLGWSPAMDGKLTVQGWRADAADQPSISNLVDAWMTVNTGQRWERIINGDPYEIKRRRVYAADEDASLLNLVDLRMKSGEIVGRANVRQRRDSRASLVEDLFVHPNFRRRGVGSALNSAVSAIAAEDGCTTIELLVHEADDIEQNRLAVRRFATKHGYRMLRVHYRRPNVVAKAMKGLGAFAT
jgi:GNAT superfamily N-acetyltransferase